MIINIINSIPSPNTHIVDIIFATILIIVIINDGNNVVLSVKRTTTNSITTVPGESNGARFFTSKKCNSK